MKTLLIFTRNQFKQAFHSKLSWLLHFGVPLAGFIGMYSLLSFNEGPRLSGLQSIGMVSYFTMIQAVLLTSSLLKDREQGIDRRVSVSPAQRLSYIAGNGFATFLVLCAQTLLFCAFIYSFFGDRIGMPFPGLLLTLCTFNVLCIGFAFLICGISDTASGATIKANMLIMCMSLLGGSFLPIEYMDPALKRISPFMPQYWVMRALRLVQEGARLQEQILPLLILLLFAVFFLALQGLIARRKTAPAGTLL